MTLYRYLGFYYLDAGDDSGWVASIEGAEFTRNDLIKALTDENTPEQRAEIEKALAALPADNVKPTRKQRRKIIPTEGDIDD